MNVQEGEEADSNGARSRARARGTTLTLKLLARVLLQTGGGGEVKRDRGLTENLKREKQVSCTARGHSRVTVSRVEARLRARGREVARAKRKAETTTRCVASCRTTRRYRVFEDVPPAIRIVRQRQHWFHA